MKTDSIALLCERDEIHDYVARLWSDGPIRRSHATGGLVHRIVDRFANTPKIFFEASDLHDEWTHFSPWWGAILLCEYENPAIRDLRYLHEIYHSATMPYVSGMNRATMAARNFQNEREASTFTEIAIYLELPDLRATTFAHPIFADRVVFPGGDMTKPDAGLAERWRDDRQSVFQELMFARLGAVLADADEIDVDDPQIVWLRRYAEQGDAWVQVWSDRHCLVDDAMIALRGNCARAGRRDAGRMHLDWLLSPAIAEGTGVPFRREAATFRRTFDELVAAYDRAMAATDHIAVKHREAAQTI